MSFLVGFPLEIAKFDDLLRCTFTGSMPFTFVVVASMASWFSTLEALAASKSRWSESFPSWNT
ncbi:hypothetical protein LINPERHAP2_LOCUS26791 [Linum perenne]